ncbi:MAG: ATP-binding protein [Rectinemataceae bacterium]
MKEDQNIEWKESWRDEYLKWICGFANAQGGTLIIGRDDKGNVTGIEDAEKLLVDIPNKVRDTMGIVVDVNHRNENGLDLIEIEVPPYPNPISYKGEYHYRTGGTKQELKGIALDRFLMRKQGRHWDSAPIPRLGMADCNPALFQQFREKATRSGRMTEAVLRDDDAALVENLQLTEGKFLNRAAALLFCNTPDRYISGAYIKIGFFVTDDDLRYQDEIHGALFDQVEKALDLLRTKYMKAYIRYEGIQRVEEYLFPEPALRETLLNAVIHKDYGSGIPIQVSVYEDKIIIWNSGVLPQDWSIDRLMGKHPSIPYNPLLANAFFRTGYVESWGRGIEKIFRECEAYGVPPPRLDYDANGLMLTILAAPARVKGKVGENSLDASSPGAAAGEKTREKPREKTREKLLRLVKERPELSSAELAILLGISHKGVEWQIKRLKKEGWLSRSGSDRGGRWVVAK